MKLVIPGGSGQVGQVLARAFAANGHEVVILARTDQPMTGRVVPWDGRSVGEWAREIDGADVVINLAGRSVNCRYTENNLRDMFDSRVDSTRVVGEAIAAAATPPPVWLQMSTATIYAHRFDVPNDEATGTVGGDEPDAPAYWRRSIEIAKAWEQAQAAVDTPSTRQVALRTAMVMSPDRGGIFDTLLRLVRFGLGGPVAGGRQFVSWIHDHDFVHAVRFLIDHPEITGPVNLAAPNPLPYREFMQALRSAWGIRIGLPATKWMLELGAFFLRTDTELVLKSRRVIPGLLTQAGFEFRIPDWPTATQDLVTRWRQSQ